MQKLSGSYYTPDRLADFVLSKSLANFTPNQAIRVLEPSSGDGAFIKAIHRRPDRSRFAIDAVEVSGKAIKHSQALIYDDDNIDYFKADFLFFEAKQQYDLIIGNPPFIKTKLLKDSQVKQCQVIHQKAGLSERAINNIWTSFLLKGVTHLCKSGVLAFVLPAELLQVKFAQEIQSFLKKHFNRIEIFTFKEIVFPNIGQDTLALVAYNTAIQGQGVFFGEIANLSDLGETNVILAKSNVAERNDIKWSAHIIPEEEIEFLLKICAQLKPISHYCNSGAGIVTGANKFFIVSEKIRDDYGLGGICRPIIQRGQFVNGDVLFGKIAFKTLVKQAKPSYLLDFHGRAAKFFSGGERNYIEVGVADKIPKRFKCRIRKRWFDVPGIWSSEAFFFKRCHLYPKLIKNSANVLVTDAAYRIKMKKPFRVDSLIYSFYNSLTLALAELKGRFYGGGVLELTPNEFKSVPLPYLEVSPAEFKTFRRSFEEKPSIDSILEDNDVRILEQQLNLSTDDVKRIQIIRKSLLQRRLRKL